MKISLIGMASAGKSHWSKQFKANGFQHIDLDDLIRQRLVAHLNLPLTTNAMMNDWLKFPDTEGFADREHVFLDIEALVFKEILNILEKTDTHTRLIIDTGGSLIYAPSAYWQRLRQLTTIIYLKSDKTQEKTSVESYLQEGRSIIWHGVYQPMPHETRHDTYVRCYANLVTVRENFYEKYADCAMDYYTHRQPSMGVADFLKLSKN
jgi:shikimate kinase